MRAVIRPFMTALALLCTAAATAAADDCRSGTIWLRGGWGEAKFTVELAQTPADRARGLMFRDSLPRGAGMLFVYERPGRASFWMKNTRIPLDMVFADRAGRVVHVHHDARPGDLTAIEGGENVFAVLEINAGLAARYGIGSGSEMRHPAFAGGKPAWPC